MNTLKSKTGYGALWIIDTEDSAMLATEDFENFLYVLYIPLGLLLTTILATAHLNYSLDNRSKHPQLFVVFPLGNHSSLEQISPSSENKLRWARTVQMNLGVSLNERNSMV